MIWFEFGSFQFEVETRILAKDGHPVALTPKAADLLLVFLEDPARLFSKDQLKRMVWPGLEFVEDSNLFFQMSCVRGALGEDATCNRFIENLPKRGYRFVVPVNKRSTDNAKLTASPTAMERAFPEGGTVSSSVIPQPSSRLTRLFTHRWVGSLVLGFLVTLVLAIELRRVFPPAQRIWVSRYVPLTHDGLDKLDGSLLADGVRVFFRLRAPGGVTLANVAVGGGDTGQIAPPKGFRTIYDLSTRTSEVLASPSDSDQEKPLWAVSLIGGSPRRIGNLYAMDAKWSPNGRKIALMIRQDLYVANSDGSQSRRIARMSGV